MSIVNWPDQQLVGWIRDEVELERELTRGSRGNATKRVQEWLNLHGHGIVVDGDFGPVTAHAVAMFQEDQSLRVTGDVGEETYARLVKPMTDTLKRIDPAPHHNNAAMCMAYARQHLQQHPVEVGGQNRGPWVRLYCKGNEGAEWPWCAFFVTFIMRQAAETRNDRMPIHGSGSCDSLAAQAKQGDRFVRETRLSSTDAQRIADGAVFLVRRTSTDWTHTGFTTSFEDGFFETIEGNTNDDGSREGYEVCRRLRGYEHKDFILL